LLPTGVKSYALTAYCAKWSQYQLPKGEKMCIFNRKPNIAALEKKKDIENLSKAIKHKDAEVRFKAIGALGKLKATAPLIEALKDAGDKHRALAAHYLGQIDINSQNSLATIPLTQVLEDEYVTTRYNAATSLELIGDRRALEPLIEAYRKEQEYANRLQLERAIKRLQRQ
jgi:HEAT repeat protein